MKMASQRFCLRWNNHQSNLLSVFDQLLHAETFTDVTLAVEGQYLKAHKMVLSACSPYFNALFVNHPEKHPIVILKDVPYSDMKSLLDFMYRGEVSVDQERLTAFLRVAESLRIKGLTEVNDDKPSAAENTPAPPQLQRIQPYLVPQRNRSQANLLANAASNVANQAQTSLLSSVLMPKRKRGRPRKLSGSSNGTGNDNDEFDREGMLNDSEIGNGKLGNDSFSGNDDGSDDNQLEFGNNDDMNTSRDSLHAKRSKTSKEQRVTQQDDNSTSGKSSFITTALSAPELSQRLFGCSMTVSAAMTGASAKPDSEPRPQSESSATSSLHLPTILGLKIRAINPPSQAQPTTQQSSSCGDSIKNSSSLGSGSNSLLKQQLRGGAKDPEAGSLSHSQSSVAAANPSAANVDDAINEPRAEGQQQSDAPNCDALQSLANAAERQGLQAPNSSTPGDLRHKLLLHIARNPLLKHGSDYFQAQQQQQQRPPSRGSPTGAGQYMDDDMDLLFKGGDHQDKSEPDHELLTLADENAGLPGYQAPMHCGGDSFGDVAATAAGDSSPAAGSNAATRPVQRRRVRRKAQSTIDDQAEHLTEMSVRGLDLFRYASVSEGVYQCTECAKENMQKTFKNKYSFQRHAFLYHEGKHRKVFPCPVCSKEFSRPDKMKNHLKMTHENFTPPKDMVSFSPLKYLITATAAGDMHTKLFQQQQQQQQQQEQFQRQLDLEQQPPPTFENQDNTLLLPDVKQEHHPDISDFGIPAMSSSPPAAAAEAMLTLQDDVIIKNEIQISPSPSPPATCAPVEGNTRPLATTAQTAT
ncbi:protein tramtrack, alpha isoform isoform X1 [Scaptodrosophila lebanonensis]|uniref:Protein tramtrack, alpha isoform isoform X1 n=1 Tax=Drosophila lebanonensis TaxID=7225 RepID=A0A6J2T2L1_DROLE|nr:protein tramtrack, alpha isoform isoform X1 [Scaptodrosophila lebanonensis]